MPNQTMSSVEKLARQSIENDGSSDNAGRDVSTQCRLDLAENIVRNATAWQAADGRIIDPYVKKETNTVTARYVGALGLQMLQGRCLDLAESCAAALTPALEDLFYRRTDWGEFIVKEAIMAYVALKDKAPSAVYDKWTHYLSDYDPEQAYGRTFTHTPDGLQNFCTFAIAGETLKRKFGF